MFAVYGAFFPFKITMMQSLYAVLLRSSGLHSCPVFPGPGADRWQNGADVIVDYNTADPLIRWDSYQNICDGEGRPAPTLVTPLLNHKKVVEISQSLSEFLTVFWCWSCYLLWTFSLTHTLFCFWVPHY